MRISFQSSASIRVKWKKSGFTLMEMMIGMTLGLLIMASMGSCFVLMNRSMDALGNYEELDRQSRYALDTMSRDIRQAACLTNFTTTNMVFTNQDGGLLKYSWDGTNYLTYTNGTTQQGGTLLKGCVSLKFDVYTHTPSNGTTMTFWPTSASTPYLGKVVIINWICRRTNYATLTDTESVQTAKVVLRN